jgi:spore coat polysaccharide biosynthesis protein SpsF
MKAIFITVRNGSTRLSNKALMEIQGIPTIEYVVRRVKNSKLVDKIVLCTTENEQDDSLVNIAIRNGIDFFRGSEEDKLERWRGAARKFNIEFFCTADGDDLFCDPALIDLAFEQFQRNNSDFIECKKAITGAFTYGIKVNALNKVCEIKDTDKTEMMWVYFTDTGFFKCEELENVPKKFIRSDIRMTLDYQEDFDFFNSVIEKTGKGCNFISLDEIVDVINKYPELNGINFFRQQQWADNQKAKTNLKLKGEN